MAAVLRILLVEDDATNRLIATRMLIRLGHAVDTATDGDEALRAVRSVGYDLILMDVVMPRRNGLATTRLIRGEPGPAGHTPIVGLTASDTRHCWAACRAAGMNDVIRKPIRTDCLSDAIARASTAQGGCQIADEQPPVFDPNALLSLASDIGADGVVDVVALFLTEAPNLAERLTIAANLAGHSLLRETHSLASAARCVGLLRVAAAAEFLESSINTLDGAADHARALCELLREATPQLAAWLARQPTAQPADTVPIQPNASFSLNG